MTIVENTSNLIGVQGIYAIVNIRCSNLRCPYGKPYIGQSMAKPDAKKHKMGIGTRLQSHKYKLRKNDHGNPKLQNAWNKYGEDVFKYLLVEVVGNTSELTPREQYWIDVWDCCNEGYNVRAKADTTRGFFIRSTVTDQVICEWVSNFNYKYGRFPSNNSGMVEWAKDNEPISWYGVDAMLRDGNRNIKGDRTLSSFIADKFGIINRTNNKKYNLEVIFGWMKMYKKEHGCFPNKRSGKVSYASKDGYMETSWEAVDASLRRGNNGLDGGLSLARLSSSVEEDKDG